MKDDEKQMDEGRKGSSSGGFPFGRFDHALDPKKRLTIPAAWRDLMDHPRYLYVLRDPHEPCLALLSTEEMESRMLKLREGSLFNPSLSAALRYIGGNSELVSVDAQGRIRICDRLLKAAGLEDKVVLIGLGVKMELWPLALKPAEEEVDKRALQDAFAQVNF